MGDQRRVLVTGGAGFIGSHLVDRLLDRGAEVTVLDNFSAGTSQNLDHHSPSDRLSIHRADIRDTDTLRQLLPGVETVFHLAAFADLRKSLSDRRADLDTNLLGMISLLDAMADSHVPELVYVSTSSLYGEAARFPTPEDYGPIQTSLYGASKLAAEAFAEAYTSLEDLRLWVFRLSNVVGERCRRGIVWDLVHKLLRDPSHLEILGDGTQSKEYLDVSDCVDGILVGHAQGRERVNRFNVATDTNLSAVSVADLVVAEMGLGKVEYRFSGGRSGWVGDNPVVSLDTSRLKACGWHPSVTSEEALRRTVRWTLNEARRAPPPPIAGALGIEGTGFPRAPAARR